MRPPTCPEQKLHHRPTLLKPSNDIDKYEIEDAKALTFSLCERCRVYYSDEEEGPCSDRLHESNSSSSTWHMSYNTALHRCWHTHKYMTTLLWARSSETHKDTIMNASRISLLSLCGILRRQAGAVQSHSRCLFPWILIKASVNKKTTSCIRLGPFRLMRLHFLFLPFNTGDLEEELLLQDGCWASHVRTEECGHCPRRTKRNLHWSVGVTIKGNGLRHYSVPWNQHKLLLHRVCDTVFPLVILL